MLVKCTSCNYAWDSKSKRPNPRFISCPNCAVGVELRESKLKPMLDVTGEKINYEDESI